MASSASLPAAAVSVSLLLPLLLLSSGFFETASAVVHKVGNDAGWTTINPPNYTAWALSQTFHVGDTLLFEYNAQYHNVEQVSKSDYKACDANNPIKVYTSGNDSIPLKTPGRFFFMCGVPGHCTQGQKVDVLVEKASSATGAAPAGGPAASPAPATGGGSGGNSSSVGAGAAPSPSTNAAAAGGMGAAAASALAVVLAASLI